MLPFFSQYSEVEVSLFHFKTNPSSVLFFWNLPIQPFTLCHVPSMGPLLPHLQFFSPCWVIFYRLETSSFFPILYMFTFGCALPITPPPSHFTTSARLPGPLEIYSPVILLWTFIHLAAQHLPGKSNLLLG